jgi:hypothetical protein
MINTDLHNTLVEKEMENKLIESDKINQRARTYLMIEKLKSVLLIIGVIFLVCLLLIFLYWIFPNKNNEGVLNIKQIEKLIKECSCDCNCSKNIVQDKTSNKSSEVLPKQTSINVKETRKIKKDINSKVKNGDEYIKHDNYVYKRTWKDNKMIKEIKMEPTIDETRKSGEKIPQFASPVTVLKKHSPEIIK